MISITLTTSISWSTFDYKRMRSLLVVCWVCYILSKGSAADDAQYQTVNTSEGALKGQRLPSAAGGSYWSFKGVPYARPPLGDLRFQDARPLDPWNDVRDALKEGSECVQFFPETKEYVGSEDCLYLNVYSPQLPQGEGKGKPLPVMFFIHGGGFVFGSGTAEIYSPDYFMNEKVVLVTINYRLGPFGFLYLDHVIPGNAGLKDQVTALRWVQRNIAAFGGDPGKVTIFGESAGGVSVHLHMMAPISQGLFQGAIAQSGAALNPWAQQQQPQEAALRLGRLLGCGQRSPSALARCLRAADAQALIRAAHTTAPTERDQRRVLAFSWVPTPDFVTEGVERFISEPFMDLVKRGANKPVPYMTGVNAEEGFLALALNVTDYTSDEALQELDDSWDVIVPPELMYPLNRSTEMEALQTIRKFYLGDKPLNQKTLRRFFDLISHVSITNGVLFTVKEMAQFNKSPIYLYHFIPDDKLNFLKLTYNITRPGAAHGDELGYLFNAKRLPVVSDSSTPGKIRETMVRMWTNFAKNGDPTSGSSVGTSWKSYSSRKKNYLEIGAKLKQKENLYEKEQNFWNAFYNTYTL